MKIKKFNETVNEIPKGYKEVDYDSLKFQKVNMIM